MSLLKFLGNAARKSNGRASARIEAHDRKVSDGKCCHCSNYHWNRCYKHDFDISDDEAKTYGCKDFSPQDMSLFDY